MEKWKLSLCSHTCSQAQYKILLYFSYYFFFVVVVVLHQNKRLPFCCWPWKDVHRFVPLWRDVFVGYLYWWAAFIWLSLIRTQTRLCHLAASPPSPPFFYLSQSYLLTLQAGLDGLPPHFIFTSFVLLLLHILTLVFLYNKTRRIHQIILFSWVLFFTPGLVICFLSISIHLIYSSVVSVSSEAQTDSEAWRPAACLCTAWFRLLKGRAVKRPWGRRAVL